MNPRQVTIGLIKSVYTQIKETGFVSIAIRYLDNQWYTTEDCSKQTSKQTTKTRPKQKQIVYGDKNKKHYSLNDG